MTIYKQIFFILISCFLLSCNNADDSIDREALVKRHIPFLSKPDIFSPFTVGNGEFAYTVDITGLQTFTAEYDKGIPLGTLSQWGWHSLPNLNNYSLNQTFEYYDTYGREVPYEAKQKSDAGEWLRANPHRLHLGKIGFKINKSDGTQIKIDDIKNIDQQENIWEGIIKSSFSIEGKQVNVETACHPELDQITARIKSDLLQEEKVGIEFDFPYGSLEWGKNAADWNSPDKHKSEIISQTEKSVVIERELDSTKYYVSINWNGNATFKEIEKHSFVLSINKNDTFEFTCSFSENKNVGELSNTEDTFRASKEFWKDLWETGGAIDLSGSEDPWAKELERRIVLSRYLTRIQCAGKTPPQETGLTCNSWYGKFHLEMHWWHAIHFVLWDKPELLEKSLDWYKKIIPMAKKQAEEQGYEGVRWPKMVGYDGRESPSTVGVFLIWQQPHPIYYAELLYQCHNDKSILSKYKDLVFASANFMASYAHWDEEREEYVLGPPLIPAQEIYKPDSTLNPAFELSYWNYGLRVANKWKERLGLARNKKWDEIIDKLSRLPENNGYYQNAANALNTFTIKANQNDHPTLLGVYGMLPGYFDNQENNIVDIEVMRKTLKKVMQSWNWETTWGWDYPMIAMTAARIGEPEIAIQALLLGTQKNTYLNNGHNFQNDRLPIYLPGNGGLLTAVAMMAAGWGDSSNANAPGFPKNGDWVVKYEGLHPLP